MLHRIQLCKPTAYVLAKVLSPWEIKLTLGNQTQYQKANPF